jgi:hypothetical protein
MNQLKDFLQNSGEMDMALYVNKIEMVKDNMTLMNEFVKKMFDTCKTFSNFLKTL